MDENIEQSFLPGFIRWKYISEVNIFRSENEIKYLNYLTRFINDFQFSDCQIKEAAIKFYSSNN